MQESSATVLVDGDVELWSVRRTSKGFACRRTVYRGAALRMHAVMAASGWCALPDDHETLRRIANRLPSPVTAKCSVTRPSVAVSFFADEKRDRKLAEQAQRLVGAVASA